MSLDATCRDEHRRARVRRFSNGIDYVETGEDRRTLTVHFFNPLADEILPEQFRITGGGEGRPLRVVSVARNELPGADPEKSLDLRLSGVAELTPYALTLSGVPTVDPLYSFVGFSVVERCASRLDCAASPQEVHPPIGAPQIDYLAKDYASFRQLILDRLATTMPGWTERHVPDLGIAIVEVLAYVADYLSYHQDAVATEAYLGTARRRVSVRRHARLVDYSMHEGCNARAWLHLKSVAEDRTIDLADTFFITSCRATGEEGTALLKAEALELVPSSEYEVFEPVLDVYAPPRGWASRPARHNVQRAASTQTSRFEIVAAHSEMQFYTWGSRTCWLRAGATTATLLDGWLGEASERSKANDPTRRLRRLSKGDVLILEERRSASTGSTADADPAHRHAVRLTSVERIVDPLFDSPRGRPVVKISWSESDALPFDLCLAILGPPPGCRYLGPDPDRDDRIDMAVALGNVILIDHGRTVAEAEDAWPGMTGDFETNATLTVATADAIAACEAEGELAPVQLRARRFEPVLTRENLTFSVPRPKKPRSATELLRQAPHAALPEVTLYEQRRGIGEYQWTARADLLDSDPVDRHFVVEVDDDRVARIRVSGRLWPGSRFRAQYRVGNGDAGNVGAGTIRHAVSRAGALAGIEVRNPLAANGGVDPEPIADVKVRAPDEFKRTLERAITGDDYARLAERHPDVQRAAARIRWAGSRESVVVAIDPIGGVQAERGLLSEVKRSLFRYRRIGHDLTVVAAAYAPLVLELRVCVKDGYLRGHVRRALLDAFSNRRLPGGGQGFFHPDRLTFGTNVYPSRIIATAQNVAGVDSVEIRVLTRVGQEPEGGAGSDQSEVGSETAAALRAGELSIGPFEIARLDNDPSHPERGVLTLDVRGGR
jgi:hypothetical protein